MDTSKRICALRRYMQENALDACVLMSPENMQYMSGFQAITYSRPIFFVITAETTYLIIPALEEAHADVTSTGVEHLRVYYEHPEKASPIGSALFPALLLGCCLFPVQFHTIHYFPSGTRRVAGGGMVLLRRPIRGIGGLARDQIDGYRPVTGHFLRLLFGGFPFFQGASPPVP